MSTGSAKSTGSTTAIAIPSNQPVKQTAPDFIIKGKSIIDTLSSTPLDFTKFSTHLSKRALIPTNLVANELDESYGKIDHVPGLKTTLFQHQQTAVKAMMDLEYQRTLNMTSLRSNTVATITYNAAVLSEPVGSGKTIDILAMIMLRKIPRAIPDIMELDYPSSLSAVGYIRRRFKKLLTPTLIFVGISVMKQWELAISTFSNLKFFSVGNVHDLRKLIQLIVSNTVNQYDIILVKNGKITVPIVLPEEFILEDKNKKSTNFIWNIIANMRKLCWARVVIDDFDTIGLPHNAGIINGIMTWFVSSTRKKLESKRKSTVKSTITDTLRSYDVGCGAIMRNHFMFYYLNVRNNIGYLRSTTNIPNPKFHVAIFDNPNDKFISLIAGMDQEQSRRIAEMLNGDAFEAAAEAAGIKSTSVSGIFETLLGSQYKKYRFSSVLLSFIEHVKEGEDDRLPMSELPEDEKPTYSKEDLKEFREVEYKFPGVNNLIETEEKKQTEVKKETGTAIQRVKDNIKSGSCPVCRQPLSSSDTVIIRCCGTIFCAECAIKAQNLQYGVGRCSNCRTQVNIKSLIYMKNFDLSKIENEDIEDDVEELKEVETSDRPRNKFTCICDIIMGRKPPEDKRIDLHIPNMMKGVCYLKEPEVRKVMMFANYGETLNKAIEELKVQHITYWRLNGTAAEIAQTMEIFRKHPTSCALVIDSTKHCSGLNLQFSTDLVFMHNITDINVESQVAGRGHRLGRTSPLNIWYIQYKNEYEELVYTHSARDLTSDEIKEERKREMGESHADVADVKDNKLDCFMSKQSKYIEQVEDAAGIDDAEDSDESY